MKLLEMNHIKKEFDGLGVLKDISLSVEEGEIVSIIGPSGSGKSTILRCATRCFAARRCLRRLTAERSCTWGKKLPG